MIYSQSILDIRFYNIKFPYICVKYIFMLHIFL